MEIQVYKNLGTIKEIKDFFIKSAWHCCYGTIPVKELQDLFDQTFCDKSMAKDPVIIRKAIERDIRQHALANLKNYEIMAKTIQHWGRNRSGYLYEKENVKELAKEYGCSESWIYSVAIRQLRRFLKLILKLKKKHLAILEEV